MRSIQNEVQKVNKNNKKIKKMKKEKVYLDGLLHDVVKYIQPSCEHTEELTWRR